MTVSAQHKFCVARQLCDHECIAHAGWRELRRQAGLHRRLAAPHPHQWPVLLCHRALPAPRQRGHLQAVVPARRDARQLRQVRPQGALAHSDGALPHQRSSTAHSTGAQPGVKARAVGWLDPLAACAQSATAAVLPDVSHRKQTPLRQAHSRRSFPVCDAHVHAAAQADTRDGVVTIQHPDSGLIECTPPPETCAGTCCGTCQPGEVDLAHAGARVVLANAWLNDDALYVQLRFARSAPGQGLPPKCVLLPCWLCDPGTRVDVFCLPSSLQRVPCLRCCHITMPCVFSTKQCCFASGAIRCGWNRHDNSC